MSKKMILNYLITEETINGHKYDLDSMCVKMFDTFMSGKLFLFSDSKCDKKLTDIIGVVVGISINKKTGFVEFDIDSIGEKNYLTNITYVSSKLTVNIIDDNSSELEKNDSGNIIVSDFNALFIVIDNESIKFIEDKLIEKGIMF